MAAVGTLENIVDSIAAFFGGVTLISNIYGTATKQMPPVLNDAQLPALMIVLAESPAARTRPMADTLVTERTFIATVYWSQFGTRPTGVPLDASLWTLVDEVDKAYMARLASHQNYINEPSVTDVSPLVDSGFQALPYGSADTLYAAVSFTFSVRYMRAFTQGA